MNERIYKTLASSGVFNLVLGIITLVTGMTSGILLIITAARLLKQKKDIMI